MCIPVAAGGRDFLSVDWTTKTFRRTADTIILLRGYRAETVQPILGHKSFLTMIRYYMSFMGNIVAENMRTVNDPPPRNHPKEARE